MLLCWLFGQHVLHILFPICYRIMAVDSESIPTSDTQQVAVCKQYTIIPTNTSAIVKCWHRISTDEEAYIPTYIFRYLQWIPITICMIGLKQAIAPNAAVWRFFGIPTFCYWAFMIMDSIVWIVKLNSEGNAIRKCHMILIPSIIGSVLLVFSIGLILLFCKLDGVAAMANVSYSVCDLYNFLTLFPGSNDCYLYGNWHLQSNYY